MTCISKLRRWAVLDLGLFISGKCVVCGMVYFHLYRYMSDRFFNSFYGIKTWRVYFYVVLRGRSSVSFGTKNNVYKCICTHMCYVSCITNSQNRIVWLFVFQLVSRLGGFAVKTGFRSTLSMVTAIEEAHVCSVVSNPFTMFFARAYRVIWTLKRFKSVCVVFYVFICFVVES